MARLSTNVVLATAVIAASATAVAAKNWGDWNTPVNVESLPGSSSNINTPSIDGCASTSPDGLTLLYNSFQDGNFDIFMATRSSTSEGFGETVRLPAPINTSANDSCPTLGPGNRLYFSSNRDDPSYDIYVSKRGPEGWSQPQNLGPNINTPGWLDESPAFFETEDGHQVMLFSSRQNGGAGDGNIYQSIDGGPKILVGGGPNSSASDNRPSVTRDGLTIFFDSDRTGGLGLSDIYYATRSTTSEPFGPAIHVPELNSASTDSRPVLSKDGSFLVFGSGRPGGQGPDIWYASREKVTGN